MEQTIKDYLNKLFDKQIDKLIEEETQAFRKRLQEEKYQYISKLLESIRIYYEQDPSLVFPSIKIIYEERKCIQ